MKGEKIGGIPGRERSALMTWCLLPVVAIGFEIEQEERGHPGDITPGRLSLRPAGFPLQARPPPDG